MQFSCIALAAHWLLMLSMCSTDTWVFNDRSTLYIIMVTNWAKGKSGTLLSLFWKMITPSWWSKPKPAFSSGCDDVQYTVKPAIDCSIFFPATTGISSELLCSPSGGHGEPIRVGRTHSDCRWGVTGSHTSQKNTQWLLPLAIITWKVGHAGCT